MCPDSQVRRTLNSFLVAFALLASAGSQAVTILSGPTFAPAANAPLAGLLKVTTDVASRVSVLVNDGTNTWERDFYNFAKVHSVPLLGFLPGRTNLIQVTVYDKYRHAATAAQPLVFVTPSLPSDFPTCVVLKSEPAKMEPGYTLFNIQNRNDRRAYITIVNNTGQVVWYMPASGPPTMVDVRQLDNGDLFIPNVTADEFMEYDLLGQLIKTVKAPAGYPINQHDGVPTDHGTILYLSDAGRTITNFPTSNTDPNAPTATTNVDYNLAVEISATNGTLLHTWNLLDLLDPKRVTYLTYDFSTGLGLDIQHANAILEDPRNNSIIVSMREQNAVIEISRATGKLKWILGPHANWGSHFQQYLLTPVGTPFEWNYGQHAPMLTPQGTLLVYDDGNDRASPFVPPPPLPDQDNYSRAVEYSINQTNMEVSQVWDSGVTNDDRLFTPIVGDADWLPKRRNVLVTYGYVTYINGVHPSPYSPGATMVRIKEFTHDPVPQVVFDLSFFDYNNTSPSYLGYFCYRSDRIPDLYAHLKEPVTDLVVSSQNGIPHLEFSADPTQTYVIQASTDLRNWTTIGSPVQQGAVGDFDFDDLSSGQFGARFYRVVTQ